MIDIAGRSFAIPKVPGRDAWSAIRAIPGCTWDKKHERYRVPLGAAPFVDEFAAQFRIDISAQAREAIRRLHTHRDEGVELPNLDAPLRNGRTLYAHQKTGIEFLVRRRRAILADDMGLGKTCQALVAAQIYGLPIHVLCPSSLRSNWTREAVDLGILVHTHSWAKVPKIIPGSFVLIADEAHYMQSGAKSQRGKAALELAEQADAVFLLTGTPMKNGRPINMLPLLQAVRSPLALNKGWFEQRYCDAQASAFSRWDTSGASNLDELGKRVAPVMLRRMKTECLDLPPKTRVMRDVEQTAESKRLYHELFDAKLAAYQAKVARGEASEESEALVKFGFMRMASSVAKVEATIEIAEDVIEQQGCVVIFTAYLEAARRIAAHFSVAAHLASPALLIGETAQNERQALVDGFQSGKSNVFVTTFGAGGTGITLTRAQTVILNDRPWTPGDAYQAEDRIHRIGQLGENILSVWPQWDDVDKAYDALLESKTERIEVVMAGRKQTLQAGMSMRQFAEMAVRAK